MPDWNISPQVLDLPQDEVHVWQASLCAEEPVIQKFLPLLSPDEKARAERFYFARDRQHFIVARGILRTLLGRYLNLAPERISFVYNPYGKPALDPSVHRANLHFNLAHSHQLALYAFSYVGQLGIDVEYMRSDMDYEQLASHAFSAYENTVFHSLSAELRQKAFFDCWTRKEAYIKARGKGLSIPLDQFDVSLRPGEPAVVLACRQEAQASSPCTLRELDPASTYASALAVEGAGWHLRCWLWQG
ncbi:4'-phosphopantetheinyl transferase superfamily protein [Ktedonosporobacter rubrisoli]|uniref:4'-phosphopantetheinyl transferase superfamily protein n=1 Tax=Ktedonosporobacter rubrisoli TaxID=2509675 RepID=A0A4P6K331_KTERU|nr:4'-phosphopantetheinyl transferase superfamily protein [Ktedonosporobacter rubrisoli]QBD82648.1 4'-phosphopantetheinyl transferase superfamily protein [Ktedonosporobacter rubrisoli]